MTSGVLADAVRRCELPALARLRNDLLGEDPLGEEEPAPVEVQDLAAAAAVLGDVVDRHLGAAVVAQPLDRGECVVEQPGPGMVPVDQAGVGALGDPRQRRVPAALVEVVESQHGEPEAFGEA